MSTEVVSLAVVKELISMQERAFRQTAEMFATNMKEDINSIQKTVDDLKCSLNFSQRDIDDIKLLCEYISIPLCEIINESFISGIFPDPLKLAKVIPLYKKQSPDDPPNYRTISLLSISVKL